MCANTTEPNGPQIDSTIYINTNSYSVCSSSNTMCCGKNTIHNVVHHWRPRSCERSSPFICPTIFLLLFRRSSPRTLQKRYENSELKLDVSLMSKIKMCTDLDWCDGRNGAYATIFVVVCREKWKRWYDTKHDFVPNGVHSSERWVIGSIGISSKNFPSRLTTSATNFENASHGRTMLTHFGKQLLEAREKIDLNE